MTRAWAISRAPLGLGAIVAAGLLRTCHFSHLGFGLFFWWPGSWACKWKIFGVQKPKGFSIQKKAHHQSQLPLKTWKVAWHLTHFPVSATRRGTFKHLFQSATPHNECLLEIEYSAATDLVAALKTGLGWLAQNRFRVAAPNKFWSWLSPFLFIVKFKSGSVTEAYKKLQRHSAIVLANMGCEPVLGTRCTVR